MLAALSFVALLASAAEAHFTLLYPGPRGLIDYDASVNFCGGYNDATTNRTTFPLTGGFVNLRTTHPDWVAAVTISTAENPNSFDTFKVNGSDADQFLLPLSEKETKVGTFCLPVNITAANIPGAVDGANVTIQVLFNSGDGDLYQCADLTLSNNFTIPESEATCTNTTTESDHHDHDHGDDDHDHDHDHAEEEDGSAIVQKVSGVVAAVAGLAVFAAAL